MELKKIKTSEKDTLKSCITYLQMLRNQGKLLFVRNNSFSGSFARPDGSQGYIRNNMPGSPDLIIFVKGGRNIQVELKSSTGKQSPDQIIWEKTATNLGHNYYIVRSVEELAKILSYYK